MFGAGLHMKLCLGRYFFVVNTINGNVYFDMLQNYAIPQIPQGYVFQQDGAPPYFALHVRDHLNECFPQKWIGRGGPTAWSPRSPDLTPLDFFFFGIHKRHCVQDCSGRFGGYASENCRCLCNCDSRVVTKHMARTWISPGDLSCYKRCTHRSLLVAIQNFGRPFVNSRKRHFHPSIIWWVIKLSYW